MVTFRNKLLVTEPFLMLLTESLKGSISEALWLPLCYLYGNFESVFLFFLILIDLTYLIEV